ncbi:MAG: NUDIX domain-containing protein, partial [Gammaproteobacteria bacterium]
KRPPAGIWGGLWGFPEMPPDEDVVAWCRRSLHLHAHKPHTCPVLRHSFSHFHLDIEPVQVEVSEISSIGDNADRIWFDLQAPPRLGLSAPVKRLLNTLAAESGTGEDDA